MDEKNGEVPVALLIVLKDLGETGELPVECSQDWESIV